MEFTGLGKNPKKVWELLYRFKESTLIIEKWNWEGLLVYTWYRYGLTRNIGTSRQTLLFQHMDFIGLHPLFLLAHKQLRVNNLTS